jgi:hypothetical protein
MVKVHVTCKSEILCVSTGSNGFASKMDKEQARAYLYQKLLGSAASWYAYHIGYLLALASVKLSILVFYLSFATHRTFRILVHICIIIVAVFSTAMILVIALQCPKQPQFALSPDVFMARGRIHCFDLRAVFYWQAGCNIASDLVILVLPMPLLFRLRMHRTKRLSLIAVFSVGLLVPIASGIRLWGLYLWANSGHMARYYGGYVIFWFVIYSLCFDPVLICCRVGPKLNSIPRSYAHLRLRYNHSSNGFSTGYHYISDREVHTTTTGANKTQQVPRLVQKLEKSFLHNAILLMIWRSQLLHTKPRYVCRTAKI